MSRTNLDILFQVTAPVGERSCFNMPRVDELGPGFGDHLSQASSTTSNDSFAAGSAGDQPPADDSSPNDERSSTDAPPTEIATAAEAAARDREDTDADDAHAIKTDVATQSHESSGTPAQAAEADDSEDDTDEDEVHSEELAVAVAETVNTDAAVVAASAALTKSAAAEVATVEAKSSDGVLTSDESTVRVALERAPTDSTTAALSVDTAAESDNVTAATTEVVTAPTASHEPVDKTASSKAARNPRATKSKPLADTEQQAQRGELNGNQVGGTEQQGHAAVSTNVVEAKSEWSGVDQMSGESGPSQREACSDENRDTNARSSARQRNDAVALANKVTAAAVANVATRSENIVSPTEGVDGTAPVGKAAAAKVDAFGDAATRLHANASPSKRAGRVNNADEMPRVDPARFVGRVAKAFHTAQERGGTLQIRLSPPELGAMRLELTVKDGVMSAALETETASARRVLLEHLPALRDRLAEQNIRVERFDVDVRREGAGGQADPRATQDQQQPQHNHPKQRRRQAAPPPLAPSSRQIAPATPARTNNNGINLVA